MGTRKIFKKKWENKLYELYKALDKYFNRDSSHLPHVRKYPIWNVVPLLFQAATAFFNVSAKDYTKVEKYDENAYTR